MWLGGLCCKIESPRINFRIPCKSFSSVIHLGNKLTYNLLDNDDILLKSRQLSWEANGLFAFFGFIDPVSLIYFSHTVWLFMVVSSGVSSHFGYWVQAIVSCIILILIL